MGKKRQRTQEIQINDGGCGSRGKPKLSKLQEKMSRSLSGAQVLLCHGNYSFYLSTRHVRG